MNTGVYTSVYFPKSYLLLSQGRGEEALAALDDPSDMKAENAMLIMCSWVYDPIRDDPRFAKALAAFGLTEANARARAWLAAHPPEKPEPR